MTSRGAAGLMGLPLLALVLAPIVALALSTSPASLVEAVSQRAFLEAFVLSAWTSAISIGVTALLGLPLSWWLGRSESWAARVVASGLVIPLVIPPSVLGLGLLVALGRGGLLGALVEPWFGVTFTPLAVILVQVSVAAPIVLTTASSAFRRIDDEVLLAARALGASPFEVLLRVGFPIAAPGILAGLALGWARALGEFGATLFVAGNLPGRTQTLPVLVYAVLEQSVSQACALALCVVAFALAVVGAAQWLAWRASA